MKCCMSRVCSLFGWSSVRVVVRLYPSIRIATTTRSCMCAVRRVGGKWSSTTSRGYIGYWSTTTVVLLHGTGTTHTITRRSPPTSSTWTSFRCVCRCQVCGCHAKPAGVGLGCTCSRNNTLTNSPRRRLQDKYALCSMSYIVEHYAVLCGLLKRMHHK